MKLLTYKYYWVYICIAYVHYVYQVHVCKLPVGHFNLLLDNTCTDTVVTKQDVLECPKHWLNAHKRAKISILSMIARQHNETSWFSDVADIQVTGQLIQPPT